MEKLISRRAALALVRLLIRERWRTKARLQNHTAYRPDCRWMVPCSTQPSIHHPSHFPRLLLIRSKSWGPRTISSPKRLRTIKSGEFVDFHHPCVSGSHPLLPVPFTPYPFSQFKISSTSNTVSLKSKPFAPHHLARLLAPPPPPYHHVRTWISRVLRLDNSSIKRVRRPHRTRRTRRKSV